MTQLTPISLFDSVINLEPNMLEESMRSSCSALDWELIIGRCAAKIATNNYTGEVDSIMSKAVSRLSRGSRIIDYKMKKLSFSSYESGNTRRKKVL